MQEYKAITQDTYLTQDVDQLDLDEVEGLFKYFLNNKESRIHMLIASILKAPIWPLPINRMNEIDDFLKMKISIYTYTEEEFNAKIRERINFTYLPQHLIEQEIARFPKFELREPTYSLIYDIGALLGELIIMNVEEVSWDLERDKEYYAYGHPVLKHKDVDFYICPTTTIRSYCSSIVEGTERTLIQIYESKKQLFEKYQT